MSSSILSMRMLLTLLAATALTACSIIPGQRMTMPPSVAQSGGEYSSGPRANTKVPITDINLDLIEKMGEARSQMISEQTQSLFANQPQAYAIGPGDVLQITVWDHPELTAALGQPQQITSATDAAPGFLVDDQGDIQFPYAGVVHVAGKSAGQIQQVIVERISKFYKKPEVTVRIASFRSSTVYVDGEVRQPGALTVNDIPMTLTQALGRAGGFTTNADQSRIDLMRGNTTYALDLSQMIRNGHNPSRIMLHNGDIVQVSARDEHGVYLMGEVNKPATIMPMRNGTLTLAEALSQAGSFDLKTANPKQLYVIRVSKSHAAQVYHLDATSPVSMVLANQFNLQPKDIVYVDSSGLVKFSRILDLLLPAINAGLTGAILSQ